MKTAVRNGVFDSHGFYMADRVSGVPLPKRMKRENSRVKEISRILKELGRK